KREARHQRPEWAGPTAFDVERGRLLRLAANELRAAGRLREAAEAFRRALIVIPRDGWLLYEFSRFLRSQAGASRDARLMRRSRVTRGASPIIMRDSTTMMITWRQNCGGLTGCRICRARAVWQPV